VSSTFLIGPKLPIIDFQADGSTYGENMRHVLIALQAVLQANVINLTTSSPPANPTNGATYIVGGSPSGVWVGQANNIAYWSTDDPLFPTGAWFFYPPNKGWIVGNQADGNPYIFNGSAWVEIGGSGGGGVSGKWPGNWIGSNASGYSGSGGTVMHNGGNVGMELELFAAQPQTVQNPTATTPRSVQIQSPSLNVAAGLIDLAQNLTPGIVEDWFMSAEIVGNIFSRYFFGWTDQNQSNVPDYFFTDTPVGNFIGFRWSYGTDVNIKAICQTASFNETIVDTGISAITSRHDFEIVPSPSGIKFYVDGTLVATINTNVPASTTAMSTILSVDPKNNGSSNMNVNFYYVYALLNS
jgi:hypothetical protein